MGIIYLTVTGAQDGKQKRFCRTAWGAQGRKTQENQISACLGGLGEVQVAVNAVVHCLVEDSHGKGRTWPVRALVRQ